MCACACVITNLKNRQPLLEVKNLTNVRSVHNIILSFEFQQQVPSVVDNNKIVHIIVGDDFNQPGDDFIIRTIKLESINTKISW